MFGLSFVHLGLVAIIALVFIGPQQLPEVARMIARLMNEWKRATSDFTSQFTDLKSDFHNRLDLDQTIHDAKKSMPFVEAESEPEPEPEPEKKPEPKL
jgi:sec-independent protein translocase protein TatB